VVRIEHIGRPARREPDHNPYDPVPLIINGKTVYGRPVEFDSEPAGSDTVLNAGGEPIRPTSLQTACPDCGLEIRLAPGAPPSACHEYVAECPRRPSPAAAERAMPDPFQNPHLEGIMEYEEVDTDLMVALSPPAGGTVASRKRTKKAIPVIKPEAD